MCDDLPTWAKMPGRPAPNGHNVRESPPMHSIKHVRQAVACAFIVVAKCAAPWADDTVLGCRWCRAATRATVTCLTCAWWARLHRRCKALLQRWPRSS
jgi:hypothetical protein